MTQAADSSQSDLGTIRDTAESIWIAIVLAFVLRAFFVEAFVIPTGSMAPRLMGEHWDLRCPNCGYEFAYGWTARGPGMGAEPVRSQQYQPSGADCPNCQFHYSKGPSELQSQFVNAGDRVLVMKYVYPFRDPEPWDVIVFRNPQENHDNYIKRLIGLPGETIELVHGDVFYKSAATGNQWRIRRKPAKAQEAMWQVVFNNDYQPVDDVSKRWKMADPTAWEQSENGREFRFKGGREDRLNFWAENRSVFEPLYGYNNNNALIDERTGVVDICTDLKLAVTFLPNAEDSAIELGLTSFQHRFRATLKADGSFVVQHAEKVNPDQWEDWTPANARVEKLKLGKGHDIALTHADFQLKLWIDGAAVFASDDAKYPGDQGELHDSLKRLVHQQVQPPQIHVAASGGASRLMHLQLSRDVFYTSMNQEPISPGPLGDYARSLGEGSTMGSNPAPGWGTMDHEITLHRYPDNPDLDSFFCLGDNSPQSLDGRAWIKAAPTLRLWKDVAKTKPLYQLGTVPRYNIIGKALFVYWPAGFRPPLLDILPILPNVGRMRLIR